MENEIVAGPEQRQRRPISLPMRIRRLALLALLALLAAALAGPAPTARAQVALILAIDSSISMEDGAEALRRAHADALRHPAVGAALAGSRVAVVLWGGWARMALPWRDVAGPEDAARLADAIEALPSDPAETSGAESLLHHAVAWREACACPDLPLVLDVASDGVIPWTGGLRTARERLLDLGATINTLHAPSVPFAGEETAGLEDEIAHYRTLGARRLQALAGGPRAFSTAPEGAEDLARALRRKILLEVAAVPR